MTTEKELNQKLLDELNRRLDNPTTTVADLKVIAETLTGIESAENMRNALNGLAKNLNGIDNEPKS